MLQLVVFCSYDVIFTAGEDVIIQKFKDFNSRVIFSAEGFCWPDTSLVVSYHSQVTCTWKCLLQMGLKW